MLGSVPGLPRQNFSIGWFFIRFSRLVAHYAQQVFLDPNVVFRTGRPIIAQACIVYASVESTQRFKNIPSASRSVSTETSVGEHDLLADFYIESEAALFEFFVNDAVSVQNQISHMIQFIQTRAHSIVDWSAKPDFFENELKSANSVVCKPLPALLKKLGKQYFCLLCR